MSKSNDLSLSFASGIGTEAIADEPFSQPDLYTDLDRLERSVEAEFELYLNQARSFPFHQDGLDSNHEQEESLGDQPSPSRQSISPGAYFGARSLPLNSIWSQQQQSFSDKYENDEEESEPHMEYKTEIDQLLALRFKSLPNKIHIRPRKKTNAPTHTRTTTATQTSSPKPCKLEPSPSSPLHFVCELSKETVYVKVIQLKLTNPNRKRCTFALFSAEQLLEFDQKEGLIAEQETVTINVSVKPSALREYQSETTTSHTLSDKLLVLIDTDQSYQYHIQIDFTQSSPTQPDDHSVAPTGRPKCRYCALEQGYPLYSLP
ncbi:hypothetical protein A0J61_09834 [Choanephora cucurbitarum]|uniref:MSP domain-containing protein n=1 Tax=Choanephora cucurbitarum TaxID=101091 RepID=A0A1C7MZ60_9FUNG|nr:hypothetical protein A0J61_09834 [Choanephora cucurbitarum]